MAELEQLLQHIPSGRQVLREHHCNLQRVAEYCESNYLQVRGLGPAGVSPAVMPAALEALVVSGR